MIDPVTALAANMYFALRISPIVVAVVSAIRGIILLMGQKREFERWTRNFLLSALSVLFLPGTAIFVAIRFVICKVFGISVENIGGSWTYGEINLFLRIDQPPRVSAVVVSLFVTFVLSVFTSLTLLSAPTIMVVDDPVIALLCWYVAIGLMFNTSLRSGDLSLIAAAMRKRPRTAVAELAVVLVLLVVFYIRLMEVTL